MYFGEREAGPHIQDREELTPDAWRGIAGEILRRTQDGFFAQTFPSRACPDNRPFITGCDMDVFYDRMRGDNPEIPVPLDPDRMPATVPALELVEWAFRHISEPLNPDPHPYHGDFHFLYFNRETGQAAFAMNINTVFRRHRMAFELQDNGEVRRIGPPVLREELRAAVYRTGDHQLDRLLERARQRFCDADFHTRYDGLRDLFDAFERLKTLEPPNVLPASAQALIARVSNEAPVREMLDAEMRRDLNDFGNGFFIRHANAAQVVLQTSEEIDYLFHRLYAVIRLLLRSTARGG